MAPSRHEAHGEVAPGPRASVRTVPTSLSLDPQES